MGTREKFIRGLIVSFAGIGIIGLAAFVFVISAIFLAGPANDVEQEWFIIERDANLDEVITQLVEEEFVSHPWAARAAFHLSRLLPSDTIKPGSYRLSKTMSPWEIAVYLTGTEPYMKWITIKEGLRKEQIATLLQEKLGWSEEERERWITDYTEEKTNFREGVFFPDTYLIPVDESPQEVVDRLIARFSDVFTPYHKQFTKQNIRWTTGLTLASIVQREAADAEDMPIVAGVLWNRLEQGMRLEVDATLQYARGKADDGRWWAPITPADRETDSPFNTYRYEGVPPHPIASPGVDAIEAVLNPAETECLFYIHSRGTIYCSETFQQHRVNIEAYL